MRNIWVSLRFRGFLKFGFFLDFLLRLGFETQGFVIARQALYCLTHSPSPFCSGYFAIRSLPNYLPGLASNCDPPNVSVPSS
jgi:hypothetical protein